MTSRDFQFVLQPYDHQRRALRKSCNAKVFALFMEQRCVDGDTEYLSPTGWRRVADYNGGLVAQWNSVTRTASFVTPKFFKTARGEMLRVKTSYGVDQIISLRHRVPVIEKGTGRVKEMLAEDLLASLTPGCWRAIPGTFRWAGDWGTGLPLTETQLRLQVSVMADGAFPSNAADTHYCVMNLKRDRKKERLRCLLTAAVVEYQERIRDDGYSTFTFYAPWRVKTYDERFWGASAEQLRIIADEVWRWDGAQTGRGVIYRSMHVSDADFVQLCMAAQGVIATRTQDAKGCWTVRTRSTIDHTLRGYHLERIPPEPGFMYSFEVPTTYLLYRRNGCIFPSGNTGKTKVTIDTAAWLYHCGRIDCLLVIAPNGVHRNWITDEVPKHLHPNARPHTLLWRSSRPQTRALERDVAAALAHRGLLIVAVNVEALITPRVKALLRKLLETKRCLTVIDESDCIKTPGAKRSPFLRTISRLSPYRRILTGTPVPEGSPFDLYNQLRFLDWEILGFSTAAEFRAYYAEFADKVNHTTGQAYKVVKEYRHLDELTARLEPHSFRVTRAECFDLPPKVYQKRYFSLTDEQRCIYDDLRDQYVAELRGQVYTVQHALTRLLRLQQVTSNNLPLPPAVAVCAECQGEGCEACDGGFTITTAEPQRISDKNPRLEALAAELDNIGSERAVVWARFRHDIDEVCGLLRRRGDSFARYDGTVADRPRAQQLKEFQAGQRRHLVGQAAAGGRGLDMSMATTVIYYSHEHRLLLRLQSEDRIISGSDRRAKSVIDLIAEDTNDEKMIAAFRDKKSLADLITGDDPAEWL